MQPGSAGLGGRRTFDAKGYAMDVDALLRIDRCFREKGGFEAIRPETRLLLILKKHGPLSVKEAMSFAQTSYRGFYAVLGRLVEADLISVITDKTDRRVRKLSFCGDALLQAAAEAVEAPPQRKAS